jgi:D-proline reductase (dithiol) PrdB
MLDETKMKEKFLQWHATVSRMHPSYLFTKNTIIPWSPLKKELSKSRVALITTAGVHLKEQSAFDVMNPEGDYTFREIPNAYSSINLKVSHTHYNTEPANDDINVIFPLDRLKELKEEAIIGDISATHFGLMGYMLNGNRVKRDIGPVIAKKLMKENVDIVLLSPG